MGNWNEISEEIDDEQKGAKNPHVVIRHKYLSAFSAKTGRNAIAYYSAWLQKNAPQFEYLTGINDEDKNGFMACFHKMDFKKGLDLILHVPGGDLAATESIIDYFRSKFRDDIRVFVPQLSMSGGTMIAFCGKEIWMGTHSNLGPIDPQFGGQPASFVIQEFNRAKADITANPELANLWSPILGQMTLTYLTMCEQSMVWCKDIAADALSSGMLKGTANAKEKAQEIASHFLDTDTHKTHGRHIHRDKCEAVGLNIMKLESDQDMQDAVLSIHHSFILTMMNTRAAKIIESQTGVLFGKDIS